VPGQLFESRRILLRDCPAKDQVRKFAQSKNWQPEDENLQWRGDQSDYAEYWQVGVGSYFRYVEDSVTGQCYVQILSPNDLITLRLAELSRRELRGSSFDELLHDVDRESDPLAFGRAIVRLGMAAPPGFDNDVFQRISRGLTDKDDRVRQLALWAAVYSPWTQYRPLIQEIAAADRAERLRERAKAVLAAFDRAGVGEP
jgi:hypothetical protein